MFRAEILLFHERTSCAVLYENGNVSINDYEQAKTMYESAKANVNSALKQVQLAEQRVGYTRLSAPISGRVANVNAEINENVMAGFSVVTLTSGSDIEITVGIPESFIVMVHESDTVSIQFSSIQDKTFPGVISEVSYTVGSTSTTYPVTIKLKEVSEDIRPGMTAEVTFRLLSEEKEEIILVPAFAVAKDNENTYVFVIENIEEDTTTVHKQPVVFSELTGEGFKITDGLKDGDAIVTAGVSKLTDRMKVRILH